MKVKSLHERKVSAVGVHKGFFAFFLIIALWLGGKYLLPLLLPFLLGTALAIAAEPLVRLLSGRLKLRRGVAAGIGVTVTLLLFSALILLLGSIAVKELGTLAGQLPRTLHQSAATVQSWLIRLTDKAPAAVQPALHRSVENVLGSTQALTDRAIGIMPGLVGGVLEKVPGKAMSIGTGILSGYFISARLPRLRERLPGKLPPAYHEKWLPALSHLRDVLGKWLLAQGKLMAVTYGIVTLGLLLLGISYAPVWALMVAAVDAVPLLGTGTVLVPWALVRLLQKDPLQGFGLLALYALAAVTRTVLEPRFYGKHLGLDPLVILVFLYFGYRLWGFWGIVISPLLAATAKTLSEKPSP